MKLTVSKSKNATLYYVQKSYRTESGKSSTRTVERLGSIEEVGQGSERRIRWKRSKNTSRG